jgi:hypothetical protein
MIKKTIVVLLIISILIPTVGCQLSELKAIATVEDMHLFCVSTPAFGLSVKLKPTNAAKAGTTYIVNLYEKGKFRDSTSVLWNQPELDVIKTEIISFPLTEEEYNAYLSEDVSHIFSIEIQTQSPSITIATVQNMYVGWRLAPIPEPSLYCLFVDLKPTKNAIADTAYTANLYEKGKFRDSTSVVFNQPELNVLKTITIRFPLTEEEYDAYSGEDISHIFSVEIR